MDNDNSEDIRSQALLFRDLATSAFILHDTARYGLKEQHSSYSLNEHPDLAASLILSMDIPITEWQSGLVEDIAQAVKSHMGRWWKTPPVTELDKLVHQADVIAAGYY
jgi:hypothetical protein